MGKFASPAEVYQHIGTLCLQAKKFDEAVQAFAKAQTKIEPDILKKRLSYHLAKVHYAREKWSEALAELLLLVVPGGQFQVEVVQAVITQQVEYEGEQPPEWPDRVERMKTIPANEGMNRFAWDLRYDDPIQIPGAFYSGTGPKGPLALPGDYQVKLTVGGKSQTAPLHLVIDPRTKGQEAALQQQFALAVQVNDRISQLHQAVNAIRDLRSQIQTLHKRFADDPRLKPALAAADDLDHKMSEVEQKLIQVNMKGSEANLAFPNMLNERFDTFSHLIDFGDAEPTKPQLEVFQLLSSQVDEQLKKLAQLKNEDLPKVSEMIKQANLPALIVTEKKTD